MYVKLFFEDLNFGLCLSHFTSTYVHKVNIAIRVHTVYLESYTGKRRLIFCLGVDWLLTKSKCQWQVNVVCDH